MSYRSALGGAAVAVAGRALLPRLLKARFDADVRRLNDGDHLPLLRAYAPDAVLHFAPGDHRWAGDWVGRDAIDAFLRNLTAAQFQGAIRLIATSGPPWALTMLVRFDDHADAPDGTRLYANRTVLVVRTRWGKVVDHEDFYVDTAPIAELDRRLTELGVAPVRRP